MKASNSEALRVSFSSAVSTSSHGSAGDDCDALSDVYIWGEVVSDNYSKSATDKVVSLTSTRSDILLPRPLESNFVLDVHQIACGVRHAALVTRQGEVFTWGEESGGRLGHGVGNDVLQPSLVEQLAPYNFHSVACGEFHSCAVTISGDLYSWGDGTHNAGLLGNGTDVSHWVPKRIAGPLEGLQVASVTCGPWHTALITSSGQLFTFGDGTFGVLGHGDRQSVSYPREVESLLGLRTIAVSCGVWHTAAVVDVIANQSSSAMLSGKLFTWGDGDKNRLGQGDKEPRLKPTCVPALIEYNFQKVACGHSLTAGLTTSGRVFTMGSAVYGQLGNPHSDGKSPCLVEDKLSSEIVEEISCGAYHVAVSTSRNEVYTWGKGANGRLGHGDTEDRKTPALVEALRDRRVKYIACGSTFTAAICLHKWIIGAEQSQCATCRQAFGFTRKRHNCYNCGLVHCHSCSSRKAFRATMAPNPNKAYRVCDSCFAKLSKVSEAGGNRWKNFGLRLSGENNDKIDKAEVRLTKGSMSSSTDLIMQLDAKAIKQGKNAETLSQSPSGLQLKDVVFSVDSMRAVPRPVLTQSRANSRPVSPVSRKPSPPHSARPVPASGLSFSKSITDSLKKTNELLNQEIIKLHAEVDSLKQRCVYQEQELRKSVKTSKDAMLLVSEESVKTKAAKEVIKSLAAQLKVTAEKLPPGVYDAYSLKLDNDLEPNGVHLPSDHKYQEPDAENGSDMASSTEADSNPATEAMFPMQPPRNSDTRENIYQSEAKSPDAANEPGLSQDTSTKVPVLMAGGNSQVESEWIEQYEPGVYITLVAFLDGTRDLKRVRFSRRRFGENQAEAWWSENRGKVYDKYNVRGSDKASVSGAASPSPQHQ